MTSEQISEKIIWDTLKTIMDPELNVDIVSLGLVYEVNILESGRIHILMTLTSPGCPLAGMFDSLVKDALADVAGSDYQKKIDLELTFDPPWTFDMMNEETKAELGF